MKKAPLSQRDIDIIVKLLREIEPDQIYAAGDLADPHGTHRTCMEAVLGALEVAKDDAWLKNCHLWLYRGAWLEWDLGMVDMAVPLSPDELIKKRHAIYRHVSQKVSCPSRQRFARILAARRGTYAEYRPPLRQVGHGRIPGHRGLRENVLTPNKIL